MMRCRRGAEAHGRLAGITASRSAGTEADHPGGSRHPPRRDIPGGRGQLRLLGRSSWRSRSSSSSCSSALAARSSPRKESGSPRSLARDIDAAGSGEIVFSDEYNGLGAAACRRWDRRQPAGDPGHLPDGHQADLGRRQVSDGRATGTGHTRHALLADPVVELLPARVEPLRSVVLRVRRDLGGGVAPEADRDRLCRPGRPPRCR